MIRRDADGVPPKRRGDGVKRGYIGAIIEGINIPEDDGKELYNAIKEGNLIIESDEGMKYMNEEDSGVQLCSSVKTYRQREVGRNRCNIDKRNKMSS